MPQSAIGTGIVDLVLPPDQMPDALLNLARQPYARQPAETLVESTPEDQLHAVLTLVRSSTRRDFGSYRKRTLLRRIHRRMGLHRIEGLPGYIERLRTDPDEIRALAADLTINVTGFFRDPEAWGILGDKVIAPLVQQRPTGSTIRVWVPGCSTGEEAYSIAILILEHAEAAGKTFDVRLFATDVADGVLSAARAGLYPGSIAQDVVPERLERWFEAGEDTYVIRGRCGRRSPSRRRTCCRTRRSHGWTWSAAATFDLPRARLPKAGAGSVPLRAARRWTPVPRPG